MPRTMQGTNHVAHRLLPAAQALSHQTVAMPVTATNDASISICLPFSMKLTMVMKMSAAARRAGTPKKVEGIRISTDTKARIIRTEGMRAGSSVREPEARNDPATIQ